MTARLTAPLVARAEPTDLPEPPLDTDIAIETPEHIVFRHRIAGPARRFVAYAADLCVCWGVVIFVAVILILTIGGANALSEQVSGLTGAGVGFILLLSFCAEWVYFVVLESIWGRSLGKMLTGLRVLTVEGRPIGFQQAALRNVLRAADLLPIAYLVGTVSVLCTKRFQRLGDLVAGTIVVVEARTSARALGIALHPPATAQELSWFPEVVRLDAEERGAIELFLRRRHALGPARAYELAEMLMEPLARRYDVTNKDPVRVLALLYDLAMNAGRGDAPPSSRISAPPPAPRTALPPGGSSWP